MSREAFDGRVVTNCDSCGHSIGDEGFLGIPGLSDLLGVGFCFHCMRENKVDFAMALLSSGLLSERGVGAIHQWIRMQAPEEVKQLLGILDQEPRSIRSVLAGRMN